MNKKLLFLLVLLLTAATGAMAQTETLLTTITATAKEQASYSTANVATVSFSYTAYGSSAYLANWGWWGYGWSATVTPAEGYTITKCVFYDDQNRTATDSEAPFVVETTEEDKTPQVNGTPILAYTSKGIKKIDVYGYVTPTATKYAVTLADGTEDATNWQGKAGEGEYQALPLTGLEAGTAMTVKYNGTKKVIGVKAAKKGGGEPVLLTTITAADNSSFKSGSQTFGDVATVTLTGDYLKNDGSHGGWYCQGSNLTPTISVAEANGANITSVKFYTAGGGSAEDKDAPFEVTTTTVNSSNITTYLNGNSIGSYGVSKIEVYGTK